MISNLNFPRIRLIPSKTDAPLFVYPNAVLLRATSFKRFQPIARNHSQRVEIGRSIQHLKLPRRNLLERLETINSLATPESFGIRIRKPPYRHDT